MSEDSILNDPNLPNLRAMYDKCLTPEEEDKFWALWENEQWDLMEDD